MSSHLKWTISNFVDALSSEIKFLLVTAIIYSLAFKH